MMMAITPLMMVAILALMTAAMTMAAVMIAAMTMTAMTMMTMMVMVMVMVMVMMTVAVQTNKAPAMASDCSRAHAPIHQPRSRTWRRSPASTGAMASSRSPC